MAATLAAASARPVSQATCYLRQGAAKRAYTVLSGEARTPAGRYLLAVAPEAAWNLMCKAIRVVKL